MESLDSHFNLFQVPKINKAGLKTTVIGGFETLNTVIKTSNDMNECITIIFISDGSDNSVSTLQERLKKIDFELNKKFNINFISVAIGGGFPTFLAIQLRQMYHNGSDVPPVFLVEGYDLSPIQEQFDLIRKYIFHTEKIKIDPKVKIYPWSEEVNEVYENSWVLVRNEKEFEINSEVSIDKLINATKIWLNTLQLMSIRGKNVKEESQSTLRIIQRFNGIIEEKESGLSEKNKKLTFNERMIKFNRKKANDLHIYIKEIKNFTEENILNKLSEAEAAKRLAIGTKVGKFHSSALKIRGIEVSDFLKMKENFIEIYKKTNLNKESSQEASIILLQNQKDIFLEADLITGLEICESQYDLVENLPIVGHSLFVKRSDSAMINPWNIEILSIARHHKVCDTVTIQQNANELKLQAGEGDVEIVNAVLPLFDEKDFDLKPLINTKLYNTLMTFNVMQNADTLFENAYVALIGSTFNYLLDLNDSNWKNDLISNCLIK